MIGSMAPANQTGAIERSLQFVAVANALIFIISQVLIQSTFANLGGSALYPMLFASTLICIGVGIVLAVIEGQIICILSVVTIATLLILQAYIFSAISGFPVSLNMLASFSNMLAFVIFCNSRINIRAVFVTTFWIAIIYSMVYVLFYDRFVAAAFDADQQRWANEAIASSVAPVVRVLVDDGVRGARVFLAAGFTTFALFYALVQLKTQRSLLWIFPLALVVWAVVLSMSRANMVVLLLTSGVYLLSVYGRRTRVLLASAFVVMALTMIVGVFIDWNPLAATSSDPSGAARARAYGFVVQHIRSHPITGIGVAPSTTAEERFLGEAGVFPSDLGVLGVWYVFGLYGLLLYCIQTVVTMSGIRRPPDMDERDHTILMLAASAIGLPAWFSPDTWGGSGGVVMAIAFGLFLRRLSPETRDRPIWTFHGSVFAGHLRSRAPVRRRANRFKVEPMEQAAANEDPSQL